ncbi:dual specificity protein phosphatase 22 isoform X7 [Eubalaena glacialis]|uniref:dual specificity protein phosphatase 22 isoform X7 n=1 Tax=Eubalaena glacialis TaxID=27606 RepID=UPI002A5B0C1B|nr:dual specificity protein phosphatase 22 isoform X7 [Eubalaena glacialis]
MDEPHCVCPSPVDGHLDVPTSDARDAEQLSKNKVTHILSVHDSARPTLEDKTFQRKYSIHPRVPPASLAGVSRSVTLVVAYIMTVTDFGWEDALRTVRAGRSCANPNLGFQRQLQEFEERQVHQFRQWLKEEYGESPLRDAEEARGILGKYKEQGRTEPPPGAGRWGGLPASPPPAYGSCTTET